MRLSDRYLFVEQLTPFFLGLLMFVLMLVGNTLFQLLDQMIGQKWPLLVVARLLWFNLPLVLQIALPIASALGASLAMNRLARDSELNVLRACGMSIGRSMAPIAAIGALAGIACWWISDKVVPSAWRQQQDVWQILTQLPNSPVENKLTIQVEQYTITWQSHQSTGAGQFRLNGVTLLDRGVDPGLPPRISTANVAEYDHRAGLWTLKNVAVHEYNADGTTRYDTRARTEELSLHVDFNRAASMLSGEQLNNLSFAELTEQATAAKQTNSPRWRELESNRWYKLSYPLLCLPVALLAAPLSVRFSRLGPFAGVVLALGLVFVSVVALFAIKAAAISGALPGFAVAFLPPLIFLALSAIATRSLE